MKPLEAGHYWYYSPKLGLVPATVTRDISRGRLMAQYMNERWPVESDIGGAVWVSRINTPKFDPTSCLELNEKSEPIKFGGTSVDYDVTL